MQSLTDLVLEQHRGTLKQGAVLVDPNDMGLTPRVTFIIDHAVKEGRDPAQVVSRRMQFIAIDPQGHASHAGWAPHLDLEPSPRQTCGWWRTCCRRRGSPRTWSRSRSRMPRPSSCPSISTRCAPAASGRWTRPWRRSTNAWSRRLTSGPTATSSSRRISPLGKMCV